MNDSFTKAYQDQIEAMKKAFGTGTFPGAFPTSFPAFEVPANVREMAEKGLATCRDNYEKAKAAAEQTVAVLEDSYATASKGVTNFNVKAIEAVHTNVNSAFDYWTALLAAKSPTEVAEISTSHLRKQFETLSAQAKDLSSLAQKVAAESSEPIKHQVENTIATIKPAA